ncbi:MAG: hypothetical protein Q9220_004400 [cf. Caloplaca sp. 1 TL-2023]
MAKRAHSTYIESAPEVCRSSPINDRSSTFIAHYSPQIKPKDLQQISAFEDATHRIVAWRKPSAQRSINAQQIYDTGHDDDGERYGGKTLEKVLIATNVTGTVVVARWYGGVMLGPVRFDHIRTCAMEAIAKWKAQNERPSKQIKVQDDVRRRESLIAVLKQRDQSIGILRDLLAQKKGVVSSSQEDGKSNAKGPNYEIMPLLTLERLEQARDATIGWVLKEIEKVEQAEADDVLNSTASKPASVPPNVESIPESVSTRVRTSGNAAREKADS